MDKNYIKGQKIFITTEEATYDGTFHSMDEGRNRLTVKDVVKHPSEESFDGLYHFYRSEILSVKIMDPLSSTWLAPGTEIVGQKNPSIMRGVEAPSAVRFHPKKKGSIELPKELNKYYQNLLKVSIIIDSVNEDFDQAVADIMRQSIVGVSSPGILLGRRGKLSWINVCCPEFCKTVDKVPAGSPSGVTLYMFDVALMGALAFTKGLANILGDERSPTKVIHDCRFLSDCLYHHFDIQLKNVLDTQVGASFLNFPRARPAEEKRMPALFFSRSLRSTLSYVLGLPDSLVYHPNISNGYLKKFVQLWFQRPITPLMAKAMTYESIYLVNLWKRMSFVETSEAFRMGIKISLSCVRDADDEAAFLMTNCYNLIPEDLVPLICSYHNSRKMRSRKKLGERPSIAEGGGTREAAFIH